VWEPSARNPVKGFTLVEIVGRDVLSWRLVHDARPTQVCVIDSADVDGLCLVDEGGAIGVVERQQSAWRTVVSFETRSELYSMIYWRRGFVAEQEDRYHLRDEWQAVQPRVFLFAFPPGAALEWMEPPALRTSLGLWEGRPLATAIATRITAEATYHLAPVGSTTRPERATVPPTLSTLKTLLPPTAGFHALVAHIQLLCRSPEILSASQVLKHVLEL
jgi:hypothetical protein